MIHKRLQADVVREDGLRVLAHATIAAGRVSGGRVELGEQETGLRATGVANDEAWQWEAVLDEFLMRLLVQQCS